MLHIECPNVLGSAALWEGVQCVRAAPSLTSPGSSGWLDSKAAPPGCWHRQLEAGSACWDTLSCPYGGRRGGNNHGRPLAQHREP